MTTKSKVPQIRFKGFSEEWEDKKLEDLTNINQGLQIAISERFTEKVEGSYFYITNEFLKEGSNIKYYIVNPPESVLCTEDDVLMTRTGNTGEVVTNIDGAFHNNFFKIKYDSKKLTKDYLVYFLKLPKTQELIIRLAGVSTIPDLNHKDFYSIRMSFPKNTAEQTKIGNYFQLIDKLIKEKEKKYQKLKQFKKAMLDKMFPKNGVDTPEIRFKGFSGKWEEKKLGQLAKITTGSSNRQDSGLDGKYTFFDRSDDIRTSNIYLFDCEAVIVAGEGSDFVPKYFKGKFDLHQRTYAIMNFENGDSKFLFYYIYLFRKWFLNQAVGSTVKSLRLPMFQEMVIRYPQKEEQIKIGNYFQKLDNQIDLQQKELEKLKNIKKASLSKMFV